MEIKVENLTYISPQKKYSTTKKNSICKIYNFFFPKCKFYNNMLYYLYNVEICMNSLNVSDR